MQCFPVRSFCGLHTADCSLFFHGCAQLLNDAGIHPSVQRRGARAPLRTNNKTPTRQNIPMKLIPTTLCILALGAGAAFAEDKPAAPGGPGGDKGRPHGNPEEAFKKLDTNNDGSVTLEEF